MSFISETHGVLRSFLSWVETQFHTRVKTLQTDNGTEILSMRDYFVDKGINYHRSCPSTPQQNGVVQRKHRHLLNVGRALRFHANLPLKF